MRLLAKYESEHFRSGGNALVFICICPANNASSITTIETTVPAFTEATVTFGTVALGLCPTPEHVFAYPAIHPFTFVNKMLVAFGSVVSFS
jgi:hypothetical protein